jgi:hypothetical protein
MNKTKLAILFCAIALTACSGGDSATLPSNASDKDDTKRFFGTWKGDGGFLITINPNGMYEISIGNRKGNYGYIITDSKVVLKNSLTRTEGYQGTYVSTPSKITETGILVMDYYFSTDGNVLVLNHVVGGGLWLEKVSQEKGETE